MDTCKSLSHSSLVHPLSVPHLHKHLTPYVTLPPSPLSLPLPPPQVIPNDLEMYTAGDLVPGVSYSLVLRSSNLAGLSPPTPPLFHTTASARKLSQTHTRCFKPWSKHSTTSSVSLPLPLHSILSPQLLVWSSSLRSH